MMEWFKAGGFGMFIILFLGVGSLVVGILAAREPTVSRLAMLKSLPTLIVTSALFTFGSNLWGVNAHLSDDAFIKAQNISAAELPFVAQMGVTEAGQALTLGGLMAMLVVGLRLVAETRRAGKQA
jgi:hypothetical protein